MYYMTIFGYFLSWYKCGDVVYTVLNSWMRLFCFLFIQNTTHLEVKGQRWHQAATFKCSKCKIQETSLSLDLSPEQSKKKKLPFFGFSLLLTFRISWWCFFSRSVTFNISHLCDLNAVFMSEVNPLWTQTAVRMSVGRSECQFLQDAVSKKRKNEKEEKDKTEKKEPHSRTKRLLSGPQMTRLFIAALLDWRAVLNLTDFLPPCQTLCHCSCPLAETCPITPACVSAGRRRFLSWQPVIRHEGLIHLDERHNNMWRGPTAPVWQRWLIRLVEQCNNVV